MTKFYESPPPWELAVVYDDGQVISQYHLTAKAARLAAKRLAAAKDVRKIALIDVRPWGAMPVTLWERGQ